MSRCDPNPLPDQRRGKRAAGVFAAAVEGEGDGGGEQSHVRGPGRVAGVTGVRHDADRLIPKQGDDLRQRKIAVGEAPGAGAAVSGERDERGAEAKLGEELVRGRIDEHSLHAEPARRGCGGEIARVDGRRMKPSGDAARHSGVQRDSGHCSTSMIAEPQLLACGTLVICFTGMVGSIS